VNTDVVVPELVRHVMLEVTGNEVSEIVSLAVQDKFHKIGSYFSNAAKRCELLKAIVARHSNVPLWSPTSFLEDKNPLALNEYMLANSRPSSLRRKRRSRTTPLEN
jgi:hypothetical protein